MRKEVSAGGVIIGQVKNALTVLLLRDQKNKWTFPKGLIEQGEEVVTCAKREIAEEVGLVEVFFLAPLLPVKYKYRWDSELVNKTVYYFLFRGATDKPLTPQAEEGIQEVQWFPFEQARKIIGYKKTNTPLLNEAYTIVTEH